jgi:hypothetical protein
MEFSKNFSKRDFLEAHVEDKNQSDKARISTSLLPLGYNHLRIPFGGKNMKYVTKTQESERKTFDPVDSSLLIQDNEGHNLIKKLKTRVRSIEIGKKNADLGPRHQRTIEFKNKTKLTESIKLSMLKPIFIENVAFKADQVLRSKPEFAGIRLDLTNVNSDRIVKNLRKRDSIFKKNTDHCLKLFQVSKQPPEVRDKHCQRDKLKEVFVLGSTSRGPSQSSSVVKAAPRNISSSKPYQGETNGRGIYVDPNRLPYLYLCPSI